MAKAPRKYSIADVLGFGAAAPRSLAGGLQREYRRMPRNAPIQGGIASGRPTVSRKLAEAITPNTRAGNEYAGKIASLLDMLTLTGSEEPLVQARGAAGRGDYGQAAGYGILAALGAIPGGKAASKAGKEAIEKAAERGIIAYHGSPHSFDRFSLDKIGTGEGAQAYGHGLYFAEAEDVAKNYRNALARPEPGDMVGNAYDLVRILGEKDALENLKGINSKEAIATAEAITSGAYKKYKPPGSMYQVRINANPEDFIDWDKLLDDQGQKVQDVIGKGGIVAAADILSRAYRNPMYGGDVLKIDRATPSQVSQGLLEKGIAGIKYRDAMSRGKENPTSNYVVFDDALIEILKKYGIAIPALAGGGLLATQPQQNGGV